MSDAEAARMVVDTAKLRGLSPFSIAVQRVKVEAVRRERAGGNAAEWHGPRASSMRSEARREGLLRD